MLLLGSIPPSWNGASYFYMKIEGFYFLKIQPSTAVFFLICPDMWMGKLYRDSQIIFIPYYGVYNQSGSSILLNSFKNFIFSFVDRNINRITNRFKIVTSSSLFHLFPSKSVFPKWTSHNFGSDYYKLFSVFSFTVLTESNVRFWKIISRRKFVSITCHSNSYLFILNFNYFTTHTVRWLISHAIVSYRFFSTKKFGNPIEYHLYDECTNVDRC